MELLLRTLPPTRCLSLDVLHVPLLLIVMYGLMVMMHFHFGRRQAMECIIMPIFICVVPEWIFFARAGGVMLPAVGFMATAVH